MIRRFYAQLHTNKCSNLDKMDTVLGKHNLPELTQYEKKIQVTLYLIQRLNSLLKIFSEKQSKTPGPDRFNGEYYETQNVETTSVLHKMFVKIE